MQRRRKTAVVAAGVVAAVALALLVNLHSREGTVAQPSRAPKAWYTVDEGHTFFADVADKVVPFDHGGKPAYRCYLWTCDGGKTRFVSHLERSSASPRQRSKDKTLADLLEPRESRDVRLPGSGESGWIAAETAQASRIQTPVCPGGKGGTPRPVAAE